MDPTPPRDAADAFDALMSASDAPSYVVTAADGDDRDGCLVGFATQCSIDPPRFGVWLSKLNRTYRIACSSTALVVHLLREGDGDLARRFGGETGDEVDKFAGVDWSPGPEGCPVIDRLDWFAGSIVERFDTGDHVAFVLAPRDGRGRRSAAQLPESELGDIEAGHPIPDD
jgi:flavin reductase (DIM6/NTAB) family NADH-FMN oxidoreductase RutF